MPERLARRLLLIGWDAADWQMIDPLLERGLMPHLQGLIDRGTMGNIATLRPILSPMLWNCIATGKHADKHDILTFVEPNGQGGIRPVSSSSRKAKAFWNILSQHGLRSAVVGWFASHPAEPIDGAVVTDHFQHMVGENAERYAMDDRSVHPARLAEVMRDLRIRFDEMEPEQLQFFVPEAHRIDQSKDKRLWQLADSLAELSTVHNAATYLAEHEAWDVLAVYYDGIDHIGHGFMEFHPPKMPHVTDEEFALYRHVMTGVYRLHDLMLGRLLELAGPEATVLLLSDHGFHSGGLRPSIEVDPSNPSHRAGPGVDPLAWHRPQGVFLAAGPGIKADERAYGVSLLDIAPTVLMLMGVPVGRDMDGKPLTQLLATPPEVAYVTSHEAPHPSDGVHRGEQADDPYASQAMIRQLVDLGYLAEPGADAESQVARTLSERRHNLAQVYFSSGRVAEAIAVLRELVAEEPTPFLRCRLAMCLMLRQAFAEAEPLVAAALAEVPSMPLALLIEGQIRVARGDLDGAMERFDRVLAANPRLPEVHVQLGRVHLRQTRYAKAAEAFERALALDPDHADAMDGLAQAFHGLGRREDAVYQFMRSVSLQHDRPETHLNLGNVLAELGQADWAIRAYEVAAELAPWHPLPHRMIAQVLRRQKHDLARAARHDALADERRAALRDHQEGNAAPRDALRDPAT